MAKKSYKENLTLFRIDKGQSRNKRPRAFPFGDVYWDFPNFHPTIHSTHHVQNVILTLEKVTDGEAKFLGEHQKFFVPILSRLNNAHCEFTDSNKF